MDALLEHGMWHLPTYGHRKPIEPRYYHATGRDPTRQGRRQSSSREDRRRAQYARVRHRQFPEPVPEFESAYLPSCDCGANCENSNCQ